MSKTNYFARSIGCALLATSIVNVDALADTFIDPMRPATVSAKAIATAHIEAPVRLTAIFQTGERRVAVIDGKVVKSGDRVGDVLVQEVFADGVRYSRDGRIETARLAKQAAVVRSDARKDSIRQEISP
jgi:lactam utilization protein B